MENYDFSLKKLLDICVRNIRGVAVIFFVLISLAIALSTFSTKLYQVKTLIQIETSNQSQVAGFENGLGLDQNASDLDQQERIYKSRLVMNAVKEKIDFPYDVEVLQGMIFRVQDTSSRFYGIRRGGLLEFSMIDSDPEYARYILDVANETYIEQNVTRSAQEARNSLNFLNQSIEKVEMRLKGSTGRLNDFKESSIPYELSLEAQTKLQTLVEIENAISEINIREQEISQVYRENHPVYKTLLQQKEVLETRKLKLNDEIGGLPSTERDFIELSREVDINQKTLETMLNRKLELEVVEASTTGNIRVIDEPYIIQYPVSPRPLRNLALAMLFAGFLSLIYIFLREYFFKKLVSPSDLSEFENYASVMGVVPNAKESSNSFDESIRNIIANFQLNDLGNKSILITGPTSGIGKSFISYHFAKSLSKLNRKVLLIDFDLRRGDLHELFNVDRSTGMNDEISPEILKIDENLDFIARGSKLKMIFSIVNSVKLKHLFADLQEKYDHLIIDTPPILSVSDAKILIEYCDQFFMVARQRTTSSNDLKFALENIESLKEKLTGIIFNDFKASSSYYGYDYYSYKYSSNYDYEDQK